jgi:chorismate mutase
MKGFCQAIVAIVIGDSSFCHAFARLEHSATASSLMQNKQVPRWRSQLSASSVNGDTNDNDSITTSEVMSLDSIRSSLIRQEETIIFALIERAQYRRNPIVYEKGGLGSLGVPPGSKPTEEELSFLEYMITGTEALHYAVRRYTSPEEHPFFPERLPSEKVLEELEFPEDLLSSQGGASDVNFNAILLQKYIDVIVPAIAIQGDDEQYGSSGLADIAVLQALSRRVHYGKFVAESKYLADPEAYQTLVEAGDADGVMKLLTNEAVEAKVLQRARLKAATYGTEPLLAELPLIESKKIETSIIAAAAASAVVAAIEAMGDYGQTEKKVCPQTVESVYRDIIIPLTKDIEVAYLFRRCGKEPPPEFAPDRMSTDVKQQQTEASGSV